MSFTDRLVLWLHVAFAIFTVGPVTLAVMSTPRYIRKRNLVVVQYLYRTTRIFTLASLGVLVFGLVAADQGNDFSKPWLTASLTLFVVAIALLLMIWRDQHRAVTALQQAGSAEQPGDVTGQPGPAADQPPAEGDTEPAAPSGYQPGGASGSHLASVERGRVASMGGIVGLIWLVILVLMIWNG